MRKALFFCYCLAIGPFALAQAGKNMDDFVLLKGGKYFLGESNVQIELSPFFISPKEVSFQEMESFALDNKISAKQFNEWPDNKSRSAVNVTWFDAIRYANWLSGQKGLQKVYTIYGAGGIGIPQGSSDYWNNHAWEWVDMNLEANGYRLPTEAEWEFAASGYETKLIKPEAQAETGIPFNSQNERERLIEVAGKKQRFAGCEDEKELKLYAWYSDNSNRIAHPSGVLKPNKNGLYDMSGNVWEWCFDEFKSNSHFNYSGQRNPFFQNSGKPIDSKRCFRGGGWNNSYYGCAVTYRSSFSAGQSFNCNGFRLCRSK